MATGGERRQEPIPFRAVGRPSPSLGIGLITTQREMPRLNAAPPAVDSGLGTGCHESNNVLTTEAAWPANTLRLNFSKPPQNKTSPGLILRTTISDPRLTRFPQGIKVMLASTALLAAAIVDLSIRDATVQVTAAGMGSTPQGRSLAYGPLTHLHST